MIHFNNKPSLKLPEGLYWNPKTLMFGFVDILTGCYYEFDLTNGFISKKKTFNDRLGWVYPRSNNQIYICGLSNSIVEWNSCTDDLVKVCDLDIKDGQRINDGFVAPDGEIFFGVTSSGVDYRDKNGALYQISCSSNVKKIDDNYHIPNGPVISLSGESLLHSDSLLGKVFSYPLKNGEILTHKKRNILDVSSIKASPDGMTIDSDGNIFIAMWGIGEVWKLTKNFDIDTKFKVPAKFVTNVSFGGPELNRLLVSYAEDETNSGGLYEIENHKSIGLAINYCCN
jgi:xylono-1,5-lactonase